MSAYRPIPSIRWRLVLVAVSANALGWLAASSGAACGTCGDELSLPFEFGTVFTTRDSLDLTDETDEDAADCLRALKWDAAEFDVRCDEPERFNYQVLVRFPSPLETGDEVNDLVAMEWHVARDDRGRAITAPAVIVVHETGSDMNIGRMIAMSLVQHGLHAFMIQLPGYGERRDPIQDIGIARMVNLTRQSVVDVRRAADAVAALPLVDRRHIAVQGTSLGGFVAATAAGMDGRFDSVHLMLAGGDLFDVLTRGERDAARVRRAFEEAGFSDEKLRDLLHVVEPTRVAHRMDPETTWLFSGRHDRVVRLENAMLLAEAADLSDEHHMIYDCNHYTGMVYLPQVMQDVNERIRAILEAETD